MAISLDAKLNETIQDQLHNFFFSLQGDSSALSSFVSTLSNFHTTIRTHRDKLQIETLATVKSFVSIVDSVSANLLELARENERLRDETLLDISKIIDDKFGTLAISDASKEEEPSHLPAYVEPSYQWLLANLHNPYPSKETKKRIALKAKCSVRDIDSWFIDARKRIGWNALRRERFSNKQEKIIAAATQFFSSPLSTFTDVSSVALISELGHHDSYHAAFTAMEHTARSLYSGRYADPPVPSFLLTEKTTTPKLPLKSSKKRKLAVNENNGSHAETFALGTTFAQDYPYPTPHPSPMPDTKYSSTDVVAPALSIAHSVRPRSRCQSPSDCVDDTSDIQTQSRKRPRKDHIQHGDNIEASACISLPSPAPTDDASGEASSNPAQAVDISCLPPLPFLAHTSVKRKRRLSESDDKRPVKRPHHALAVPRLHAVSDPFPLPRVVDGPLDGWISDNSPKLNLSDDPSFGDLGVSNLSNGVPLEVQCHQYESDDWQTNGAIFEAPYQVSAVGTSAPEQIPLSASFPVNLGTQGPSMISLTDDLNSLPPATELSVQQDVPFDPFNPFGNCDPFVQPSQANFNWMQFPFDSIDLEPSASCIPEAQAPTCLDLVPSFHPTSTVVEDQVAKRLRLQYLRQELSLLESEFGLDH